MAHCSSFANKLVNFNESETNILNEHNNGLSDTFITKLEQYKNNKIELLSSKLQNDIFYDGTVYTGSAGLSLYYFICSLKQENYLPLIQKALEFINIENLKGRRITFLCGDAGPLALASVISFKMGNQRPSELPHYNMIAQRLMSMITLMNDAPDELLYGKSGYLYALLFVNKYIDGKEVIPASHIEKVITSILKSGMRFSSKIKGDCPLMWEWHDKIYLGAAHGMAGILYMLLQAQKFTAVIQNKNLIKRTIDWLMSQQFPSGNFPSSLGSSSGDRLVQWCHGAPGFVPLCLLAYQVFEEQKYMKIAIQLGEVIWERGLCRKGYSICHGVSGNAYAFLQLYQATKKPVYLYRAGCFIEWCCKEHAGSQQHRPDRPASLFEGVVGPLLLAEQLSHPFDAVFPAFTL